MDIDLAALPDDVETLQQMISAIVVARQGERAEAQAEIDRLRAIVKALQRNQFGRRSERLDPDQLLLGLEDLDADIARVEAASPVTNTARSKSPSEPRLPDDLPREDVTIASPAPAVARRSTRSARPSARCSTLCLLAYAC